MYLASFPGSCVAWEWGYYVPYIISIPEMIALHLVHLAQQNWWRLSRLMECLTLYLHKDWDYWQWSSFHIRIGMHVHLIDQSWFVGGSASQYYFNLAQYQKWSLSAITASLFWYNQDNLQLVHKWLTLAFVIVVAATTIKKLTSQTTRNPKTKNWKPKKEIQSLKIHRSVYEIYKYGNDLNSSLVHL